MRRALVTVLVFLAIVVKAESQPPTPDKYFTETAHDFQTVPRGAQLLHRFTWTNNEKTRREITDVRTSCGCVNATPLPRVLEPGQSGMIEVHVDAKKFVGQKTVSI